MLTSHPIRTKSCTKTHEPPQWYKNIISTNLNKFQNVQNTYKITTSVTISIKEISMKKVHELLQGKEISKKVGVNVL